MVLITQYGSDGTSLFFAPLLDVYVSAKLVDALKAENKSAPFSAGPAVIFHSDWSAFQVKKSLVSNLFNTICCSVRQSY